MARDRQAEAAKRDAKARALGFSSYGQQYRASKRGYTEQGPEYNAALAVAAGVELTKRQLGGRVVIAGNATTKRGRKALTRAIFAEARKRS
jgi:hypothetical protein